MPDTNFMVYIIAYEAGVEHDFPFHYEYMKYKWR